MGVSSRDFSLSSADFAKSIMERKYVRRMLSVKTRPSTRSSFLPRSLFFFCFLAKTSDTFMEVIFLKTNKILSTIGTLVAVGAVSMAGAALWTNVLDDKIRLAKVKRAQSNSDKVIVIDFKKARRDASR